MEMNNKNSSTYRKYWKNKIVNFKQVMIFVGLFLLADFCLLALLLHYLVNYKKPEWGILIFSFFYIFVLLVWFKKTTKRIDDADKKNYYTWGRGAGAEMVVGKSLEELLNKGYKIIDDIQNTKGNIDLVCVGLSGIFVIEVKSNKGLISWNNGICCNGNVLESVSLKQVYAEVFWVRDKLKEILGKEYFVNGILEFPNAKIDNRTIRGEIENVWIGRRGFAKWVIENKGRKDYLSIDEIEKIYQILLFAKQ
jgi:Nuclease-related domain.